MVLNYLLILLVSVLLAGLGLDAGMLEYRYLQLSMAVKASAISGALALQRGGSSTVINSAGQTSASLNGFTNGSNGVTVTIQHPPAAGPYSGNTYAVRSTITRSVATSFMSLAGFPKVTISATYDQPGATAVSMTSAFNVNAIFKDTATVTNGGFDTSYYGFSANALDPQRTSNNLGALLSWRGNLFFLGAPSGLNGASQKTISLTQSNFSQLLILASTGYGPMSGSFVVTYTNGSTATTSFSMSDWCNAQGYANEVIVSQTPYRDYYNVGPSYGLTPAIYGYTINLSNTETVRSVTLPNYRNVVVLAMDLVP